MTDKPRLRDVTVCAADSVNPRLAARALEICLDRCEFAEGILFSDVAVSGSFRHVAIDRLTSLDDYSRFCLYGMPKLIDTPFVLIVHWDGYVIDPAAWRPAFRKYDYIGALLHPTDGTAPYVGNGGFSLRSRKLMKLLPSLTMIPGHGEDRLICQTFRPALERQGIRFAPVKVAETFAYESRSSAQATFGFHGLPNLWRHEDDAAALDFIGAMRPQDLASFGVYGLIISAMQNGRLALARAVYDRLRVDRSPEAIEGLMARQIPRTLVVETIRKLEALAPG